MWKTSLDRNVFFLCYTWRWVVWILFIWDLQVSGGFLFIHRHGSVKLSGGSHCGPSWRLLCHWDRSSGTCMTSCVIVPLHVPTCHYQLVERCTWTVNAAFFSSALLLISQNNREWKTESLRKMEFCVFLFSSKKEHSCKTRGIAADMNSIMAFLLWGTQIHVFRHIVYFCY